MIITIDGQNEDLILLRNPDAAKAGIDRFEC